MATIRQIAAKAAALHAAFNSLDELLSRRTELAAEVSRINAEITSQQATVQTLRAELKTLVDEP